MVKSMRLFPQPFLWIVLVAEVLGVYGYYWYKDQLKETPIYLWIFTWDCPFYASLFSVWLYSYLKDYRLHRNAIVYGNRLTGLIKYGLWTVLIVQDSYFLWSPITIDRLGLQIPHLFMSIQGFILVIRLLSIWKYKLA